MICVIPTAPSSTDKVSLQQIYDHQAQYLGTVRHRPSHTELAQTAVLHGFRPALPVSAIQWSSGAGRFAAPCGCPPSLRRTGTTRSCGAARTATASQMVNVGATGALEASPWFEPDGDCLTWSSLYAAALAAGAPDTPAGA